MKQKILRAFKEKSIIVPWTENFLSSRNFFFNGFLIFEKLFNGARGKIKDFTIQVAKRRLSFVIGKRKKSKASILHIKREGLIVKKIVRAIHILIADCLINRLKRFRKLIKPFHLQHSIKLGKKK